MGKKRSQDAWTDVSLFDDVWAFHPKVGVDLDVPSVWPSIAAFVMCCLGQAPNLRKWISLTSAFDLQSIMTLFFLAKQKHL